MDEKAKRPAVEQLGLARNTLAGRAAVVTGGGRGIGRETARALAWLGVRVVVADISDAGRETERLIQDAGGRALFVRTDVSAADEVALLLYRTQASFGPADILINNAVISPVASLTETEAALWDRVLGVNLRGTFLTCKYFLPEMLARERGTIVNMVSTDAMPYMSAYIASKQGVVGLSRSLAAEVGEKGVRVVAFAPGLVDTPGLREAVAELSRRTGTRPGEFLEGAMPADHAAAAAAYLVAAAADLFHGGIVDGYTVLERAGFLRAAAAPAARTAGPAPETSGRPEAVRRAAALCAQLQDIVAETASDFEKLPVFVRPLARGRFKEKTGRSIEDWGRTALDLTELLKRVEAGDESAWTAFRAGYPELRGLLVRLGDYCRAVPGELARFTGDAEMLAKVARVMDAREAFLRSLTAALDEI